MKNPADVSFNSNLFIFVQIVIVARFSLPHTPFSRVCASVIHSIYLKLMQIGSIYFTTRTNKYQ